MLSWLVICLLIAIYCIVPVELVVFGFFVGGLLY